MQIVKKLVLILVLVWSSQMAWAATQYRLGIDGLACPFCAYGIEKKLSSIDGVKDIEVDIKKGEVIVTLAEGANLSDQLAREKVTDAGFTLRSFNQYGGGQNE